MTKTVTLCGSTKFKDEFLDIAKEFTLKGWIVLMPHVFGHSGDKITEEQKQMLDEIHRQKIDISNYIYVINPGGYIGESTSKEIDYAIEHSKEVMYMEPRWGCKYKKGERHAN